MIKNIWKSSRFNLWKKIWKTIFWPWTKFVNWLAKGLPSKNG